MTGQMGDWIVIFADREKGMATFDNEQEAREYFDRARTAWTCWLFKQIAAG
jgi:hypothetical protein